MTDDTITGPTRHVYARHRAAGTAHTYTIGLRNMRAQRSIAPPIARQNNPHDAHDTTHVTFTTAGTLVGGHDARDWITGLITLVHTHELCPVGLRSALIDAVVELTTEEQPVSQVNRSDGQGGSATAAAAANTQPNEATRRVHLRVRNAYRSADDPVHDTFTCIECYT
jgi:hypothetical protein